MNQVSVDLMFHAHLGDRSITLTALGNDPGFKLLRVGATRSLLGRIGCAYCLLHGVHLFLVDTIVRGTSCLG